MERKLRDTLNNILSDGAGKDFDPERGLVGIENFKSIGNNNLSGVDLPKAISDIVNDTTIKCMLDIYPSKRGSKIVKKYSLEYKDKDGFRRGWVISEKIFRRLLTDYHFICNPASVALFDYKANNYDALIDQKRYNLQFDLINEYFMYIDDYWLSTYLHYDDEDCRKHLLRQYAYETTAEEYINDAYKYALMKKCKLHKDENGLLQELELQLQCYVIFDENDAKIIKHELYGLDGIKQLQNYSSAKTSLPSNEPKGFKLIDWKKGTVNLDLGGGKTTFGTDYLKAKGVKNLIFDFNYPAEHNKGIAEYVKDNKVDTVTCFNVLNVLDTDAAIENMCLMAAKALKSDGTAYFQVYNKGSKGASQNNQSFQQGEPLSFYVPFVEKYFGKVKKTADLIIATKPIKTTKKSQWQFAFDSNEGLLFGVDNGKNLSGTHYKQLDITEYKFLYKDKEFIFKVGDTIIFKPKSENNQTEIKKIVCFEEQNAACKNGWAHEIWICWDDNTNEPVYSVAGTMYKTSLNEYDIVGYKAYNITLQELELQLAMNDEKLSGSGADENFIQDFQENIWKNGFNSVTLRQLDNLINDIQNGRIETDTDRRLRRIADKLARVYDRTMVRGDYRPRSKSDIIIASQICAGSSGKTNKRPHSYYRESLLVEWAKHANYWIEDVEKEALTKGWKRAEKLDGKESMIYTTSENKIIKVWGMSNYMFELSRGIEKIILHNFLFGADTYLNVIGITKIKGFLYYILEQPLIDYEKESFNAIAIRKFLEKKFPNAHVDFVKGQFNVYLSDIYITDLHAGNVVRISKNSENFHIIDCNIKFKNAISELFGISDKTNFKTLIVNILSQNGYTNGKDYKIRYFKSSPYLAKRGEMNVQECWLTVRNAPTNIPIREDDWDDIESLTDYVCGVIDTYYYEKKKAKQTTTFHVADLICYKGFEESVFQIVDIKKDHYIVRELGDRTQTWNEIPFADKDKLQKAVSPLLIQEIKLVNNNNSLSGIVQPFYPDHDTDDYLNDYSESKSATQAFLNDVKNFVKRLKKDLELEDYYNKGKKQTITINARDIYVQLVIPYAEKSNTYLHIEFHTNHLLWQYKGLLKGINYDYNVEPTFTIWVGETSCWFNIWNDYDDILKELKYKYSIFRDRKQQTEVSPLLTKELQLLLTKYEFYQYLKK